MTDVVIETRSETAKYDAVARMWKETCLQTVYRCTRKVRQAPSGNGTSVKADAVVIRTRILGMEVRTVQFNGIM